MANTQVGWFPDFWPSLFDESPSSTYSSLSPLNPPPALICVHTFLCYVTAFKKILSQYNTWWVHLLQFFCVCARAHPNIPFATAKEETPTHTTRKRAARGGEVDAHISHNSSSSSSDNSHSSDINNNNDSNFSNSSITPSQISKSLLKAGTGEMDLFDDMGQSTHVYLVYFVPLIISLAFFASSSSLNGGSNWSAPHCSCMHKWACIEIMGNHARGPWNSSLSLSLSLSLSPLQWDSCQIMGMKIRCLKASISAKAESARSTLFLPLLLPDSTSN